MRNWESGVLDMNPTAFAETLMAQYEISVTSNIPGSPGVDLSPRKDHEPGGNGEFPPVQAPGRKPDVALCYGKTRHC